MASDAEICESEASMDDGARYFFRGFSILHMCIQHATNLYAFGCEHGEILHGLRMFVTS
jgi:hypothetical protein